MYDAGKIITGLVIFLVIITFPFWYNALSGAQGLQDPEIATRNVPGKDQCVLPKGEMKTVHMQLLNQWRDSVVRRDQRVFTARDGRKFNMSLSNTCMDCHNDKAKFCDRCHTALAISPYCWDCHVEPPKPR